MKDQALHIIEDPHLGLEERVEAIERLLLQDALDRNDWVKLKAARDLQVTYRIFNYKYDKYGFAALAPQHRRRPARPPLRMRVTSLA